MDKDKENKSGGVKHPVKKKEKLSDFDEKLKKGIEFNPNKDKKS